MGHRVSWPSRCLGLGPGRIIDTHVHDVPLSRKAPSLIPHLGGTRPATDPLLQRMEAARLSDLIQDMNRAGVRTSLVVLQEETEEFFRLAAEHPGRLFGLASYDSHSPRQGLEQVRTLCDSHAGLIVGVTSAFPCFHQDPRLNDFVPLYEYCMQRDLAVQFHLGDDPTGGAAGHPMALAVLAKTYPRLKVVCLHARGRHGDLLGLLGRLPNLFLQVEALQDAEAEGDGEPRILRTVLRAAGGRKVMFGSNWRGRDERYLQRVETVRRLPRWQRKNVGWCTAARVYGPQLLSDQLSAVSSQPREGPGHVSK